ncbi:MAG TPA: hypothetical protein VLA15_07370 [Desulfurivibrionaceae bacterium]|nr:hypothetical protein [Desulfurivibrionaceae bacterium]
MPTTHRENLLRAFGLLSIAAARKRIYALKAGQQGLPEVAHLLRAIAESEAVQARRLLNSCKGRIDNSDHYLATVFEAEIPAMISEYSELIEQTDVNDEKAVAMALRQLRAAEKRLISFYAREPAGAMVRTAQRYYVCPFCGYLSPEKPPTTCPICGAEQKDFREIV